MLLQNFIQFLSLLVVKVEVLALRHGFRSHHFGDSRPIPTILEEAWNRRMGSEDESDKWELLINVTSRILTLQEALQQLSIDQLGIKMRPMKKASSVKASGPVPRATPQAPGCGLIRTTNCFLSSLHLAIRIWTTEKWWWSCGAITETCDITTDASLTSRTTGQCMRCKRTESWLAGRGGQFSVNVPS